jgi:CRISPR/Cas system CMR subunit Cmr4 (Cas7 group RAMP superfamily)
LSTNKISIELELKTRKKLCIGAGGLPLKTIADINFMRLNNSLIIPASTIKGVLRTCMIKTSTLLGYKVDPFVHPNKITDNIITNLMGKPDRMGKVRVCNALLNSNKFILSHVKIDDTKNIAKEGGLFSIEYIPKDTVFNSKIEVYDINKDELRLLLASIIEMNNTRVGKGGLVSVRISNIKPDKDTILQSFDHDEIINALINYIVEKKHENI